MEELKKKKNTKRDLPPHRHLLFFFFKYANPHDFLKCIFMLLLLFGLAT